MDALDKFLHSVSYKFPKGYPDMDNPKDVSLLESLISEVLNKDIELAETIVLTEANESFDSRIKSALGVNEIPKCKTPLKIFVNKFRKNNIYIRPRYVPTFNCLY